MLKKLIASGAACLALTLAAPAQAAPASANPPAQARGLILTPLTLTRLDDLSFGAIVPSNVSGTVMVPANGSAPSTTGGVTLLSTDPIHPARFAGAGTTGRLVFINVQNPGTLSDGNGNSVTVLAVTLDGFPFKIINSSRAFFFRVGGILSVGANQPEGIYEADLPVTVTYF